MFDQSFSQQNLFKVYSSENNKGNNLADRFFSDLSKEYHDIKRTRALIRQLYSRKRFYSKATFESRILLLYRVLRSIKDQKNELVRNHLHLTAKTISDRNFEFPIIKLAEKINGKDVFGTGTSAESFFAEKQIQRNIRYTYGVKQADRDLIIPQLKSVLGDSFPKIVVKTDIKSFYENIDRNLLLKKLGASQTLSLTTRKIIARLLTSYGNLSGEICGIPRGIGVSAYLSELYLKQFDFEIETWPNLIYYARYVDDIIVVLTPDCSKDSDDYLASIEALLRSENLELNKQPGKTKLFDGTTNYQFDYLGYKFIYAAGKLKLELSNKKKAKYKERIVSVIECFKKHSVKQPVKAKKELFLRLKFLTSNTKLSNNKGNAIVGIYNSNRWVTSGDCLSTLDNSLRGISNSISNPRLKEKITKFSFEKGFNDRKFNNFTSEEFKVITRGWSK